MDAVDANGRPAEATNFVELSRQASEKFAQKYVGEGFTFANNAYMDKGQTREQVEKTWRDLLGQSETMEVAFSWDKCIPDGLYKAENVEEDGAFKPVAGTELASRVGKEDAASIFTKTIANKETNL